jgi:hypothetical protein
MIPKHVQMICGATPEPSHICHFGFDSRIASLSIISRRDSQAFFVGIHVESRLPPSIRSLYIRHYVGEALANLGLKPKDPMTGWRADFIDPARNRGLFYGSQRTVRATSSGGSDIAPGLPGESGLDHPWRGAAERES